MADEGDHDVRELNRPTTYSWLGHVGLYKPGYMSTRHMGCHVPILRHVKRSV